MELAYLYIIELDTYFEKEPKVIRSGTLESCN